MQRSFFDATHHCSAWRLRDGVWRANDAGEPSGSAGAPILAAIDAVDMRDVAVVVVRYFGGTKLGVGGLMRAYAEAAEGALSAAPRRQGIPAARVFIQYAYDHTAAVMRALDSSGAAAIEHGFSEARSEPEISAAVPAGNVDPVRAALRDDTAGEVVLKVIGEAILYRLLDAGPARSA